MPEATNPKKRALMPSGPLRKALRAAGHHLSPVVQVGQAGVTPAVVRQVEEALLAHELIKVKVGTETPEDRFGTVDLLRDATGAHVAQILGRTMLLYKRHPDEPRWEPKPASERSRAEPAPARPARASRSPRRTAGGPRRDPPRRRRPYREGRSR